MKTIKYILILPILFGMNCGIIQAQNYDSGNEEVNLFTDRTLFISGEEILFAAFLDNHSDQSKTLYLELILPDGTSLVSQKHLISNKQSQGKLEIPQDILSGTYYLKAYTKYMRNFGAESFTYLPVKIVNPLARDFLSGEDDAVLDTLISTNIPLKKSTTIDDNNYRIRLNAKELEGLKNVSISVVPAHSFQKTDFETEGNYVNSKYFFPETRGLSLSGQLVDSINNEPLPFKVITLSIIDQKNFIPALTGSDGRFYFALPEITGNHDLFISTKKEESVHPKILADKDFDSEPISLPNPPFNLSNMERITLIELAQSHQISRNYLTKNIEHQLDTFFSPFYGKADNILYLDKYISFETLEEYFTELPGLVHIKNQKKEKSFTIYSTLRDMNIYPPLVLIDMVAVEDYNRILAVSPHGIEKVEIIPHPYVYGNFIYGGIISIRTRNGDFGGISLPKTGLFFNFDFFQAKSNYKKSGESNREPDTRNTLFWEVYVLEENSSIDIDFKKRTSNTSYWLVLQGLNEKGEIAKRVHALELN